MANVKIGDATATISKLNGFKAAEALGIISDRISDRRILLAICSVIGLAGMIILPFLADNRWLVDEGERYWWVTSHGDGYANLHLDGHATRGRHKVQTR